MINSYDLMGVEKFLRPAEFIVWIGIDLYLIVGNPLPMATNQHEHYEAITGGSDFMVALFQLFIKPMN